MNKLFKNYILSIISTVVGLVFPIFTFPYVSRVLGVNNLGIINFAQSYGYYFMHFASFGISSYAIREVSKVRDDNLKVSQVSNEIYNINVLFSALSGMLYIAGVIIVPQFRENWKIFFLYSITIFSNFLSLEWLLQSFDDYFYTTIRSIMIRIISLLAVFIFVKRSEDYGVYMFITCFSEMGARFTNLFYAKKHYVKLVLNMKYLNFKAHIKSLFTLFTFRMINGLSSNLDKIMIGFMIGYSGVGIYSAGVKFVLMLIPIIETVGIVLFPKINISASKCLEEYLDNLKINYDIIFLLSIPMAGGVFLVAPKVILLFSGKEYVHAIGIARIMAVIIILCPIGDLLGSKILLIYNKNTYLLICSTIVALSNIVFNSVLIPFWGINGAAIASVISYCVSIVSRLYFAKKVIPFNFLTFSLLKYTTFTIPFVIIYILFKQNIDVSTVWMLCFIIVCMVIYFVELMVSKDKIFNFVFKRQR